ncbi:MAG: TIM barrel protein [Acidobacteriota bacterium]
MAVAVLAGVLFVPSGAAQTRLDPMSPNAACYVCHMTFVREEISKTHMAAGVGCVKCHGLSAGHANDENVGATPPDIRFKRDEIDRACGVCHPKHDAAPGKVVARFLERKMPAGALPVCTDCHGSHKIARAGAQPLGAADRGREGFRHPFFALCMDTHDAKKRTLPQQAEMLKELGYDGLGHLWLDNVAERLKTVDALGLKLFQIYLRVNLAPGKEIYDPRLKDVMPLLRGRGTMLALLIQGGEPSNERLDPEAVRVLREIADLAEPSGVRVALYPHRKHWLERVEDAVRLAKKAGRKNLGVMFNLCHWLAVDDEKNLKPLLEAARPYLFAVAINGADQAAEIRAGKGNFIQPLDSGPFDNYNLLKTLKELGYTGPVGLQCFGITGDARDHLARSMAAWRKLVQRLNAN